MAIHEGLLGHWPMSGTANFNVSTVWDVTPNRFHLANATGVEVTNGVARFDASDYLSERQYSQPAFYELTGGIGIYAKVNVDNLSAFRIIAAKWKTSGSAKCFQFRVHTDGTLQFSVSADGSATVTETSAGTLTPGTEHEVMAWWSGSNIFVRLDGTTSSGTAFSSQIYDTDNSIFRIGMNGDADQMLGTIRDVMLWNKAPTAAVRTAVFSGTRPRSVSMPTVMPIVLVLGQSNANGRGLWTDLTDTTGTQLVRPQVAECVDDGSIAVNNWSRLFPGYSSTVGEVSPSVGLGQVLGSDYGIIRYSPGSTGLDPALSEWSPAAGATWVAAKALITDALGQLTALGITPVIKAAVWIQGEKDSQTAAYVTAYEANLNDLISRIRTAYGTNLPVVLALTGANQVVAGSDLPGINTAMLSVAAADANVRAVNMDDLGVISGDEAHYTAYSSLDMGRRLGEQVRLAIDAAATLVADDVEPSRTWRFAASRRDALTADNVVTLHASDGQTCAMDFDNVLNDGSTVSSITSVTDQLGDTTITLSNTRLTEDRSKVLVDIAGLTTATDYQILFIVVSTDGQTIARVGTLQARTT